MLLRDRVIIVTGSTTGIGRAIAVRCVEEGASVVVHGRSEARGRRLVESLGDRATLAVDDLADPAAPRRIVDRAIGAFGRLDGLVNNAAYVVRSNLHTTDAELFDRVIAVNLRAPFLLIQAALLHLEQTEGCVLNIGSNNGYCGEENLLAYSLSKAGLMAMSRNLGDALRLRHGIRVFHFNVGWVLTENEYQYKIADGLPPDWPEKVSKTDAPIGRLLEPEEIAAAAVWWLGDGSRPFSGSVVDLEQYPFLGRNPPPAV
ncbi:MAG: SDR family NAD(P)-dependent oxidoreductase [Planctomycetota bacterium]|jgi:NAD(P)-dependent dehydrogenase (short-subunit alcohol dehydrogenase family)